MIPSHLGHRAAREPEAIRGGQRPPQTPCRELAAESLSNLSPPVEEAVSATTVSAVVKWNSHFMGKPPWPLPTLHWDHEPVRIPLNRPSGTFSPIGGEGETRIRADPHETGTDKTRTNTCSHSGRGA